MKTGLHSDPRNLTPDGRVADKVPSQTWPATAPVQPVIAPELSGESVVFGGVNCYIEGSGPPLVLVRSINADPSAAEVRPLFEHYSATHTVVAIDLPGFGRSDRSDRRGDPRLMTDALRALAGKVRDRCGDGPIDALGRCGCR